MNDLYVAFSLIMLGGYMAFWVYCAKDLEPKKSFRAIAKDGVFFDSFIKHGLDEIMRLFWLPVWLVAEGLHALKVMK